MRAAELLAGVGADRVELPPAGNSAQNWGLLLAFEEFAELTEVAAHLLGPPPAYSFLAEPPPAPTSRWGV